MQSPSIYTVSQLTREVRTLLEASYPGIRVEGEVSNLSQPASGHKYFTLKDDDAQIRCAMFRNRARFASCKIKEGLQVVITARVSLYEARGDFQCIVQSVEEAGEGRLRRKFEQLKKRLAEEHLFDASHKISLPELPDRVGIITSPSGAAVHDIISTFGRRFPAVRLLIHPVPVQGIDAAGKIAHAIQTANLRRECDVLVLARGGGSLEDLWPFNEEVVARAIFDSKLPIVSAVGHETDFSIADLVADVRAPTPTAAAEMISPDQEALLKTVAGHTARIQRSMGRYLEDAAQRVDYCAGRLPVLGNRLENRRLQYAAAALRLQDRIHQNIREARLHLGQTRGRLQHPEMALRLRMERNRQVQQRLEQALRSSLSQQRSRFSLLHQRLAAASPAGILPSARQSLHATQTSLTRSLATVLQNRRTGLQQAVQTLQVLSPLATLARGYATLHNPVDNRTITSVQMTGGGQHVTARLQDGELDCLIENVTKKA